MEKRPQHLFSFSPSFFPPFVPSGPHWEFKIGVRWTLFVFLFFFFSPSLNGGGDKRAGKKKVISWFSPFSLFFPSSFPYCGCPLQGQKGLEKLRKMGGLSMVILPSILLFLSSPPLLFLSSPFPTRVFHCKGLSNCLKANFVPRPFSFLFFIFFFFFLFPPQIGGAGTERGGLRRGHPFSFSPFCPGRQG